MTQAPASEPSPPPRRRGRLLLALALVAILGLVAAVAFAVSRSRLPVASFTTAPAVNGRWRPRFLDETTLALIREPDSVASAATDAPWSESNSIQAEVWSLGTREKLAAHAIDRAFGVFREWVVRQPEDQADSLELWSLRTGLRERTLSLGKRQHLAPTLALSPSAELVAIEDWTEETHRRVEVRSTRDGRLVKTLELPDKLDLRTEGGPLRFRFSPREDRLLAEFFHDRPTAHLGHFVVTWSLESGAATGPDEPMPARPDLSAGWSRDAFFTQNDELLVVDHQGDAHTVERHGLDGAVRFKQDVVVWKLEFPGTHLNDTGEPPESEDRVAAVVANGWAGVLELRSGKLVSSHPLSGAPGVQHRAALSPSGDRLAVASNDGHVEVWRVPP